MWIFKVIPEVNQAIGSGDTSPLRLKLVFTVTDAARPGEIVVLALCSNQTKNIVNPTDTRIEKIRQTLLSVEFDGVGGPLWYWDDAKHGPV